MIQLKYLFFFLIKILLREKLLRYFFNISLALCTFLILKNFKEKMRKEKIEKTTIFKELQKLKNIFNCNTKEEIIKIVNTFKYDSIKIYIFKN